MAIGGMLTVPDHLRIDRSFQIRGATTWNALAANCILNQGMTNKSLLLECSVRDGVWSMLRSTW